MSKIAQLVGEHAIVFCCTARVQEANSSEDCIILDEKVRNLSEIIFIYLSINFCLNLLKNLYKEYISSSEDLTRESIKDNSASI
jgi:hypothetical protein